jgi:hypothetical protein
MFNRKEERLQNMLASQVVRVPHFQEETPKHQVLSEMFMLNDKTSEEEWLHINLNIINTTRQTRLITKRDNSLKNGLNCPKNRFCVLTNKIPLMWFNKSFEGYKIECKNLFLSF